MTLRIASGLAEQAKRGQPTQEPGVPTCQCPEPHLWLRTVKSCAVCPSTFTRPTVCLYHSPFLLLQGKVKSLPHCHPSHRPSRLDPFLLLTLKKGTDLNSGYSDEDGISAKAFPQLQWHLRYLYPGSDRSSLGEDRLSLAHSLRGLPSRKTEVTAPCMVHLSLREPVYVG